MAAQPQGTGPVNPRRFVGKPGYYSDDDTGLDLLGVRYYDPHLGCFISPDPVRDGLNWYEYAGDNPVKQIDPSGLAPGALSWAQRLGRFLFSLVGGTMDSNKGLVADIRRAREAGRQNARYTEGMPHAQAMARTTGMFLTVFARVVWEQTTEAAGETVFAIVTEGGARAFESFGEFKAAYGSAGEGRAWHHIVEQRAPNVERFGAEAIQNTNNILDVSAGLNAELNKFYSSKRLWLTGDGFSSVRQWMNTKSYSEQMSLGKMIMKNFATGHWKL